jgi:hypothetical protein
VRASEHERIGVESRHGIEISPRREARDLVLMPAFLDEGDEERAGARPDLDRRVDRVERVLVAAGADRRRGADDADTLRPRRPRRGAGAGDEHADERHALLLEEPRERDGGGRVARDDDHLDVLALEKLEVFAEKPEHRLGALRSVGETRRIAEVYDLLVGKTHRELVNDRESADSRIENADRRACIAAH